MHRRCQDSRLLHCDQNFRIVMILLMLTGTHAGQHGLQKHATFNDSSTQLNEEEQPWTQQYSDSCTAVCIFTEAATWQGP